MRRKKKIQTTGSPWRGEIEIFSWVFSAQIPHQHRAGVQNERKGSKMNTHSSYNTPVVLQ